MKVMKFVLKGNSIVEFCKMCFVNEILTIHWIYLASSVIILGTEWFMNMFVYVVTSCFCLLRLQNVL